MKPAQETKDEQRTLPPQKRKWVQCGLSLFGMLLLSIPIAIVLRVDIGNNYAQGTRYLHELGLIMAVGAVAWGAVPMVAAILGRWCWMTLGGTVIAGAMTVSASYLAYTNALNTGIDSVVTAQTQAQTARGKREAAAADLAAAQAEIAQIAETMPSTALKRLYEDALRRKEEESKPERGGCKAFIMVNGKRVDSRCVTAEREAADYLRRMGDAEAEEKAEQRVADARKILAEVEPVADTAPATQELAAIDLAMRINTTPEEAARLIARGLALLSILLTVIMGLLAHMATGLGMRAFGIVPLGQRDTATPAPRGLEVMPPPERPPLVQRAVAALAKSERPKRERKPLTPEQRVRKFVDEALIVGQGEMAGTEMIKTFNRWWNLNWSDQPPMRPRDYSPLLADAGVEKRIAQGKTRYKASAR